MRSTITRLFTIIVIGYILFTSCKKEYSCEGCLEANLPPIAIAGADTSIILPADNIVLNGLASYDPDGTIAFWLWRKIDGPAAGLISSDTSARTHLKSLGNGIYVFELSVTDNGGLVAKDTVRVSVYPAGTTNRPPIANAGPDQVITLPTDSVMLDGSASTDPDNNITQYLWTKIAGPATFSIVNNSPAQAILKGLTQGIYQFELTVTDAQGLYDKDTVQVAVQTIDCSGGFITAKCDGSTRQVICAQLIPIGNLSEARTDIAIVSAGNKIFLGGGYNGGPSSRVDIYDINANSWSTTELCQGRYIISTIAAGNKVFFAGGEYGDGTWPVDSVDIYDLTTNTWTVSHLSKAGYGMASAVVGNKVLFVGGEGGFSGYGRGRRVDYYDLNTQTWSSADMLPGDFWRWEGHSAVTVGDKLYIAGGNMVAGTDYGNISNKVYVYDGGTNTWSASNDMYEGKAYSAGIAVENKIYWAGGSAFGYSTQNQTSNSCLVEIKDVNMGTSTIQYLSDQWFSSVRRAVVRNNKIVFFKYNSPLDEEGQFKFDIYDITSSTWSVGQLPAGSYFNGTSAITVNNIVYVTDGAKLYQLDF